MITLNYVPFIQSSVKTRFTVYGDSDICLTVYQTSFRFFWWGPCSIMFLYVLSSVLWCPLLHIGLCFCFVCLRIVYPIYVASFSGLYICDCPFGFLQRLLDTTFAWVTRNPLIWSKIFDNFDFDTAVFGYIMFIGYFLRFPGLKPSELVCSFPCCSLFELCS